MPAVRAMMLAPFGYQLVHVLLELGPIFALDAARNATAARIVRHQHDITAGQRNERGERRALVAALFLLDLHNQFLAFADRVLDAGLAGRHAFGEVLLGDFLERQEAVAVFAVVDEAGFERWLDARDDRLVDIALALFAPFDFDFVVEQFLPVDDGQAALFRLRGVDQHPLHGALSLFVSFYRFMTNQRCTDDASETQELPLGPGCCGSFARARTTVSSVSSTTGGVGARGWARARCGVDLLFF